MNMIFSNTLKKLRTEKGMTQQALADRLFVARSTVVRWESGTRFPDAVMMLRIAGALGVDANTLFLAAAQSGDRPNVIMVDDRKLILSGSLPVLEEVLPYAAVTGFTQPQEAVDFAAEHDVALAFLDIELRNTSGLELCRRLLHINPHTNVIYLTAYSEYAFDAWDTGASGFMLKPITPEGVRRQLRHLRYPFWTGGAEN